MVLLLTVAPVGAHTVGKGLATVTVTGQTIQYNLLLALTPTAAQTPNAMQLGQPGPTTDYSPLLKAVREKIRVASDGRPCREASSSITPPAREGGTVAVQLQFACAGKPAELTIHDDLFDVLGAGYHTIANIQWSGGSQQFVFLPGARETRLTLSEGVTTRGIGSFFLLGIEHILTGYDHLLFLLALILRGGNIWSLLKIITAFTVAHSITLALAALNIVTLPERLVEATIALSIAYVAAENLFMRHSVSHRWAVAFVFGLMHGFGFSNVLRELGLPKEGLVWALLNFNLGVEAGQAIAVVVAVPVLMWLRRFRWEPRAVGAVSAVVLVVGLALFVDRAFLTSV
ncbi:MAG TPA: HupE/UreJ family protein [Burkholderiales bacterium]|nr:HupE/UreJ family protein [Burkholderiales bacterium]